VSDYIAELKQRVRIEEVISETVELEGHHGRGYTRGAKRGAGEHGLVVDLDGQRFAWNGNAAYGNGRYNDAITWVMIRDRVDFKLAVEVLAQKVGMEPPKWTDEEQAKYAAVRKQEDALEVASQVFHKWLLKDKKALAYAYGRGWTDETIEKARLGFTGWGTDEEYELMKQRLAATTDLHDPAAVAILGLRGGVKTWAERRGITLKASWEANDYVPSMLGWKDKFGLIYPHVYFGRVTYLSRRHLVLDGPSTTPKGSTQGELVGSDEPKSYNLPKELVGERQLFFNHVYAPRAEQIILVEGQADAITLGQWGLDAVAIAGTSWQDQAEKLTGLRKQHEAVYVALDADRAGSEAVRGRNGEWPLADILGPIAKVIRWPEKDANDWRQALVAAGIPDEDQVKMVHQEMQMAKPLAVMVAEWAGIEVSDKALEKSIQVIAKIGNEFLINKYKPDFLNALKSYGQAVKGVRELDRLIKSVNGQYGAEGEEDKMPVVYTRGGRLGLNRDWVVEYCYDPDKKKAFFAYRSPTGEINEANELIIDGIKNLPEPPTDEMILKGAVVFPSGLARKEDGSLDRRSTKDLTTLISITLRKNYLFKDNERPMLAGYWIIGTWLYDNFTELCYFRVTGDTGAGKSQLLNLMGQMCYRMVKMSGADSEATFFRVIDDYRGTLYFEEADLPEDSGPDNPKVKLINLGAMKGNFIYRLDEYIKPDGSRGWRPKPFETYCPKMFAMRGDFMDDAVQSRAINIPLVRAEMEELKEAGIPLRINKATMNKMRYIRNLLLVWRLTNYSLEERELGWDLVDTLVPPRINQVTMPLKSLAVDEHGRKDDVFLEQIGRVLREMYLKQLVKESMTWEARVAEAIWKMVIYPDLNQRLDVRTNGQIFFKIGDVTAIANNLVDEMNEEGSDLRVQKIETETFVGEDGEKKTVERKAKKKSFDLSSKRVGGILRDKFQLNVPPRTGKGYFCEFDEEKMMMLAKKYGVLPSDDDLEKAHQNLAAMRVSQEKLL